MSPTSRTITSAQVKAISPTRLSAKSPRISACRSAR